MIEEVKDQTSKLTAFHKVNDWYSQHNFGTRFAMIMFVLAYMIVVIYFMLNLDVQTVEKSFELVSITGWIAFSAFLVITLGDNALNKVVDLISKLKTGK